MESIILLGTMALAIHASMTMDKIIKALTGADGAAVKLVTYFMAWFAFASLATQCAGNALLLAGIAIGTEVALLTTDATIRKFFPLLDAEHNEIESDKEDGSDANDYKDDDDYQDALETSKLLADVFAGTEWTEAKRFVDNMVDEELPRLITLRNSLGDDIDRARIRINRLGKKERNEGRRNDLTAYRDSLRVLRKKIDAGIAETVATFDKLLVIGRERQINGATDATDRAVRLLTETHQNNELLLASQREVERLEAH